MRWLSQRRVLSLNLAAMPRSPDPFTPRAAPKKPIPYDFVLDELAALAVRTRPMFGSTAVYVDDRIVFILRNKGGGNVDDGVWVVFGREHIAEMLALLPSLRDIEVLGARAGGWRKLAASSSSFEEDVLAACRLVKAGDPRIGKTPDRQLRRAKQAKSAAQQQAQEVRVKTRSASTRGRAPAPKRRKKA